MAGTRLSQGIREFSSRSGHFQFLIDGGQCLFQFTSGGVGQSRYPRIGDGINCYNGIYLIF